MLFALQSDKGVNNGSPSLHARLLTAPDINRRSYRPYRWAPAPPAITAQFFLNLPELPVMSMPSSWIPISLPTLKQHLPIGPMSASLTPTAAMAATRGGCDYVNFAVARPAESWIERLRPGSASCYRSAYRPRTDRQEVAGMPSMVLHFASSAAGVDLRRVGSVRPVSSAPMVGSQSTTMRWRHRQPHSGAAASSSSKVCSGRRSRR